MKVRRSIATAAALGTAAIAVTSSGAAATPAPKAASQIEYFLITGSGNHEVAIAHGAFVGGGRDDASHESYDVLHLGHGTLRVTHPDSQSHFTQHLDPKTCFATFTITGKYTVGHGTGRFAHVTGHGTYVVRDQAILARTKSGACDENADPTVDVFVARASGPVHL